MGSTVGWERGTHAGCVHTMAMITCAGPGALCWQGTGKNAAKNRKKREKEKKKKAAEAGEGGEAGEGAEAGADGGVEAVEPK